MIKTYELTLLARADVSSEDVKMSMQVLRDNILSKNGEILYGEYWGIRNLEYKINKCETANFYMIQFDGDKDVVNILNEKLKNSEIFIRYLLVSIDKEDIKIKSANSNPSKDEDGVVMDRRFGNIINEVFNIK